MTKVEKAMAAQVLATGALGVGESHDNPEGRELVRHLLEQRKVSHLFLEFGSYNNATIDKAAGQYADGNSVDAMMTTLYLSITQENGAGDAGAEGYRFVRPGLGELAFLGLKRGAKVICADPKINFGASDSAMRRRNTATAKVVKATLDCDNFQSEAAKGALLLFGSDHFRDGKGLSSLCVQLPGLRWILTPSDGGGGQGV